MVPGVRWNLNVILIYIFLMIKDAGYFFRLIFHLYFSFGALSAHLIIPLINWAFLLVFSFLSSLYVLVVNSLSVCSKYMPIKNGSMKWTYKLKSKKRLWPGIRWFKSFQQFILWEMQDTQNRSMKKKKKRVSLVLCTALSIPKDSS